MEMRLAQMAALDDGALTGRGKRFALVMPLAFVTYGLAYLDRVNYASAAGALSGSLKLSGEMGALVSSAFFLGYCLSQIPAAMYASRRNVKWLVFGALLAWGGLSALTGVIRNVLLLIGARVMLGVAEGVVLPVMLVYLTRWFTKKERARSNTLLMLTNPVTMAGASALCGLIIQVFDAHRVMGYAGWQVMFIVEGLPSCVWAFVFLFVAAERPEEAGWLTAEEAGAVRRMLEEEQRGIVAVRNYRAAFLDPRVMKLAGMFFCFSSAAYGLIMWLPGIVAEGTKQRPAMAGLLTAMPYGIAAVSMVTVSWMSDRWLRRKVFVVGSMLVGCGAFVGSWMAGPGHFVIAFMGLVVVATCVYTPTGPLWSWMAEMLPRNVAGESMALVNSVGALGGFLGTLVVGLLKKYFEGNAAAFLFQAGCFLGAGVLGWWVRGDGRGEETGFDHR